MYGASNYLTKRGKTRNITIDYLLSKTTTAIYVFMKSKKGPTNILDN